ncbi:MAG: DNA photolyase family protein [Deltaproteobacteria bacterium]|nr:DNA photolyase family protein [Deltaproteobacteria bacterium]
MEKLVIYWSRRDFRLRDNPALFFASQEAGDEGVVAVFFIEPYMTEGNPDCNFGYPSRYFLAKALPEFASNFKNFYIVCDKPVKTFKELKKKYMLSIYVNEDIHPDFYAQVRKLTDQEIEVHVLSDQLTVSKNLRSNSGKPYSVFTPFKNSAWNDFINASEAPTTSLVTRRVPELDFGAIQPNFETIWQRFCKNRVFKVGEHIIDLEEIFEEPPQSSEWYFTESQAVKRCRDFIEKKIECYNIARDFLGSAGNSFLSLGLTWGLISARTIKNFVLDFLGKKHLDVNSTSNRGSVSFISELIWREFYKYLYFHHPWIHNLEFQESKRNIKWKNGDSALEIFKTWIQGKTGYSIVDAAMREIANSAFMHNRSRMIVASVLTKNFGVDWRWGQEYFRSALIDLDEASNNGGWQWAASVGADPKPIRIFNPYLQAQRFDPDFSYRKKWLGEDLELYQDVVGKERGKILPLVEHAEARLEALRRYGLVEF